MKKLMMALVLGLILPACKGEVAVSAPDGMKVSVPAAEANPVPAATPKPTTEPDPSTTPEPTPSVQLPLQIDAPEMTGEETLFYLRRISQMLVGRTLTVEEMDRATREGSAALRPILESWTTEPGFAQSARYMMEQKLKASGERDGIDFNAPGRLVEYTVGQQLPFSNVVRAQYCIDAEGNQAPCDSGAPYTAGVLTTRAYLAGNASRFNLGRASRMLRVFACRIYPMEDDLQPRLEKEALIPMFRAQSAEEQTVEEAKDSFGNGDACYTCHGQFSAHAQFFVKFDETGNWIEDADGIQDPEGELGRSLRGLMTSHMDNPTAKSDEGSMMFGRRADNLSEAAEMLTESDVFVPCMVRNVIEHTFGMTDSAGEGIDRTLLEAVAYRATQAGTQDPPLSKIMVETFIDPRVVQVVMETRQGGVQ